MTSRNTKYKLVVIVDIETRVTGMLFGKQISQKFPLSSFEFLHKIYSTAIAASKLNFIKVTVKFSFEFLHKIYAAAIAASKLSLIQVTFTRNAFQAVF